MLNLQWIRMKARKQNVEDGIFSTGASPHHSSRPRRSAIVIVHVSQNASTKTAAAATDSPLSRLVAGCVVFRGGGKEEREIIYGGLIRFTPRPRRGIWG